MKIYICEFKPKVGSAVPLLWRAALDTTGTGYYHTGMVIGDTFYELTMDKGYVSLPFTDFKTLNETRAYPKNDAIDFFEVPRDFTESEIAKGKSWWKDKQDRHVKYGLVRFIELLFWRPMRKLSDFYFNKTGKTLLFAQTSAERDIRVCSGAVDDCLKEIAYDLFPGYDEVFTVPGQFAKILQNVHFDK